MKIKQDDLIIIADKEIQDKGMAYHHITSCDSLYEIGIPQIIKQFKVRDEYKEIKQDINKLEKISINIEFIDVKVEKPIFNDYKTGRVTPLFPIDTIKKRLTYKGSISTNVIITMTGHLEN